MIRLAWRNIWRNRRRTSITILVISLAIALAIFMRSQQLGSYESMLNNTVGTFAGHIQIHHNGYLKEQNLDNSIEMDSMLLNKLNKNIGLRGIIPRLEFISLFAKGIKSKTGLVVGIDIVKEMMLSDPKKHLVAGDYFESVDDQSALLGEDLADFLGLEVGDTLVISGQGYYGKGMTAKCVIKGLVKLSAPSLNKQIVFLPLQRAQGLTGAHNHLTSLVLLVKNPRNSQKLAAQVYETISSGDYEVVPWQESLPELMQMIQINDVGSRIIIAILYLVTSSGILGTIIMMTAERRFEFGVLIAIGMNRLLLGLTILLEIFFLTVLGIILGCVLIAPIITFLYHNPVRLTGKVAEAIEDIGFEALIAYSNDVSIFWTQGYIVLFLTLFLGLYPIFEIWRLKVADAIHN